MSDERPAHTRTRHPAGFLLMQRLRCHYGDQRTAQLLGITNVGLDWKRQTVPVWRGVAMLDAMTFSKGSITVFDLLTSGQFPAERPQAKVACGVSLVVSGTDLVILNNYSI